MGPCEFKADPSRWTGLNIWFDSKNAAIVVFKTLLALHSYHITNFKLSIINRDTHDALSRREQRQGHLAHSNCHSKVWFERICTRNSQIPFFFSSWCELPSCIVCSSTFRHCWLKSATQTHVKCCRRCSVCPDFDVCATCIDITTPDNAGRWTNDEHERFMHGLDLYGKKWTKIAEVVGSRTTVQVTDWPIDLNSRCALFASRPYK